MKQNKGFWIMFWIYVALFIGDMISTIIQRDYVLDAYEVNILYGSFGVWGIVAVNLVVMVAFWFGYCKVRYNSLFFRFATLNSMVLIIITRIWAISNNIKVYLNPPTVEVAQATALNEAQRQIQTVAIASPIMFYFIVALITFILYRIDHHMFAKDKKHKIFKDDEFGGDK